MPEAKFPKDGLIQCYPHTQKTEEHVTVDLHCELSLPVRSPVNIRTAASDESDGPVTKPIAAAKPLSASIQNEVMAQLNGALRNLIIAC